MLRAPCSLSTSSKATSAVFGASDSEWLEPLCWNLRKVTGEAAWRHLQWGWGNGKPQAIRESFASSIWEERKWTSGEAGRERTRPASSRLSQG